MYIERVILKGVPGIPDHDLRFYDEWRKEPIKSVLIKGLNGSGKTTILRVISMLWEYFGGLVTPNPSPYKRMPTNLVDAELLAIKIVDLWDKPVWIYSSPDNQVLGRNVDLDDDLVLGNIRNYLQSEWRELIRDYDKTYLATLDTIDRLHLGVSNDKSPLPNMVFLEASARQIVFNRNDERAIITEPLYRWFVKFDPYNQSNTLEVMLRNLKLRDPKWFQETLDSINEFLRENGKRLTDFDQSLRLRVESLHDAKQYHYIEALSSGEQQTLILMFMVSRWLQPGGVVLIDEPDLHMHVAWQRQFIHELEKRVLAKQGQLIVTSHSHELWEEYNQTQRFDLSVEQVS